MGDMSDDVRDFVKWERKSRDTIDVKRVYVDVAGDLVSGVLLSQIVYWFLPDDDNQPKVSIVREGRLWLAKKATDWHKECRLSAKQYERSERVLVERGLIEARLFQFNGIPTKHVSLNFPELAAAVKEQGEEPIPTKGGNGKGGKSISTKGANGNAPNGKTHFDERGKSTMSQTTTENTTRDSEPPLVVSPADADELAKIAASMWSGKATHS